MANRKNMLDEALLRPDSLEVQMEIGLPDESGRVELLKIHTRRLKENGKLGEDVDFLQLAASTENFTGEEIEGLVRAATCIAMNSLIKVRDNKPYLEPDASVKLKVTMNEFHNALETDFKSASQVRRDKLAIYVRNGIVAWGEPVNRVLEAGELRVNQARVSEETPPITLLLEGMPGCGKTALAAQIALNSTFPFMKICTSENMVGFHEAEKAEAIKEIFNEARKSELSCVILDDIELLIDYSPIGPRYSNMVLQTLLVLLRTVSPAGRKLMVIGNTSRIDVLQELEMLSVFENVVHVSAISSVEGLRNCLENLHAFTTGEIDTIVQMISPKQPSIGIKKLLNIIGRVEQVEHRVAEFVRILEEEGNLAP